MITKEARTQLALMAAYQAEEGMRRQRLIAEDVRRRGITGGNCVIGKRVGIVDPVLAAQARAVHGEHCWADPEFIEWTLKHSPEVRVPN